MARPGGMEHAIGKTAGQQTGYEEWILRHGGAQQNSKLTMELQLPAQQLITDGGPMDVEGGEDEGQHDEAADGEPELRGFALHGWPLAGWGEHSTMTCSAKAAPRPSSDCSVLSSERA